MMSPFTNFNTRRCFLGALLIATMLGIYPLIVTGDDAAPPVDPPEKVTIGVIAKLYGPVTFSHAAHNDYVEKGCASCHHKGLENFEFSCTACHRTDPSVVVSGNPAGLKRALHVQCVGCHRSLGAGPVGCTDCHVKAAKADETRGAQ